MTFYLPPVLDVRDLPGPVLRAAALDGELWRVGDGYAPVDLPSDAASRALSLRGLAAGGRILADRTAAWVWGAAPTLPEPRTVIVTAVAVAAHGNGVPEPGVRSRLARVPAEDLARPGGVAVTTPRRTAIDLACAQGSVDDGVLCELIARAGTDVGAVIGQLMEVRRLRGRDRAIARLQLLVTR